MKQTASKGRVLVVEDDAGIRTVISEFLGLHYFDVKSAENGKLGLEAAESWSPNVILLDLAMPVMDGYHFLEQQKATPAISEIPIIVVTASYTKDSDLSKIDVELILRKPLDFDVLLDGVRKHCEAAS